VGPQVRLVRVHGFVRAQPPTEMNEENKLK
jgi:hypothetical protein